jgi:hypothetical protein
MNTLYFFGDSYTEGHALQKTEYIWPKLIQKSLKGYKYKNVGYGGASPVVILKQVLKELQNIKAGDIVFLLETVPDRVEIVSKKTKNVFPVTNGHIVNAIEQQSDEHFETFDTIKSAFNYIYDHRFNDMVKFANFYREMYTDLGMYFKKNNIRFILLEFNLTFDNIKDSSRFETVKAATKGKVQDGHFSILGNWQFAKYVLKSYFKKEEYQIPEQPKIKLLI